MQRRTKSAPQPTFRERKNRTGQIARSGIAIRTNRLRLAGRSENFLAFVHVELLHLLAGRPQVFAGIGLCRFVGQHQTHGGRHGQTAVRVDVDLANRELLNDIIDKSSGIET